MQRIVVIATSAGSLGPRKQIISALPTSCTASVFIVLHVGPNQNVLPAPLAELTELPVLFAEEDTQVGAGYVYVGPAGYHVRLKAERIRLDQGPKVNYTRLAADPLFLSAAETYRERVVGIVLSGYGEDGAEGLRVIEERGGLSLVQDLNASAPAGASPLRRSVEHAHRLCPNAFRNSRSSGEVPLMLFGSRMAQP